MDVPPQNTRLQITRAGYIPKKIKQTVSRGAKKGWEKPVFLLSCYPVNMLFLICFIWCTGGIWENRSKDHHPGGASGLFCIISFHVVALRNASHPMIRLPFRSFGRCSNETVQGQLASVRTETAKSVSSHRIGVLRSHRVPLKHAHACAHRYLSTSN